MENLLRLMQLCMMKFNTLWFTIITVLLVEMCSSKQIQAPDMKPISNRFADLLNSLVKVNAERVDALKNLLKYYDVSGAKHLLRATQDEEDDSKEEVIVFDKQDEPESILSIINKPVASVHDNKRLCLCQDTEIERRESDMDEALYDDFKEQSVRRINPYNEGNLEFNDNEPSDKDDKVVSLNIDKKLMSNQNNSLTSDSTSSEDEIVSIPLKSENRLSYRSKLCISPQRGYEDCKDSCKDAYGSACAKYSCSESLYKQLRHECKYACRNVFEEPYEDDYEYY